MTLHLASQRLLLPSAQVSTLTTGSITLPSARGAYASALATSAFESIASSSISGSPSSVTFSSIPQTYKHLEVRVVARTNATSAGAIDMYMQFNSVTSGYNWIESVGSSASNINASSGISSTTWNIMRNSLPRASETGYGVAIARIMDYTDTNKNRNAYWFCGYKGQTGYGNISNVSGTSGSAAAISSLTFSIEGGGTFTNDSHITLYGLK